MTSSYRRVLLVTFATAALFGLSVAGAGGAFAAGIQATAIHAGNGNGGGGNGNGNGNGNGGNGGNGGSGGSGGSGQGTATPELPSGVLFGLGVIPLAAGLFLVWRRRRPEPA
ncbi:MAG: hypothetical protein E6J41_20905 [Chloroflexi bacterium]|nr:MAG: hypothetical protein E6J41_20905 [Chloroflexota bacterium]